MQTTDELVLRKSITVKAPPHRAFEIFTAGVAGWWPLSTHSIGEENAAHAEFEPRVGGRFFERTKDGEEHLWGTVTAWEPPVRLAYTWHPGYSPDESQDVELTFTAEGDGTRIDLVHSGWERRGAKAEQVYADYDTGWDFVLGERYAEAANA